MSTVQNLGWLLVAMRSVLIFALAVRMVICKGGSTTSTERQLFGIECECI